MRAARASREKSREFRIAADYRPRPKDVSRMGRERPRHK
jgi:hypothetical protein